MAKVKPGKTPSRPQALAAADRLHSAAIHLLRRVRQQDAAAGVGPAQLSALSVLVFAGSKAATMTLGKLAAAEQVKPPTMSRVAAGLQRNHLVTITRDPHDSRRLHIRATPKGTRLLHQARQRRIEYLAARIESLSCAHLAQLSAAVRILEELLLHWH
jgi:DNA-binding MarR family transcriptional regulator